MRIYYRISDKSYAKPKLIGATKEVCLMNFITVFQHVIYGNVWINGEPPPENYDSFPSIRIIADRCERTTQKMLRQTGFPVAPTDLGNAGSLKHCIESAMELPDDKLIYFCEDDYLHLSNAPKLLEEGIKRSDYVSLYDHPDKYTRHYNLGEHCKVIKTESSHWRNTISTCMTFGTKVKTLKADWEIWKKHISGDHPYDHHIFTELTQKGRRLIIPIPGAACHTDLTFSGGMNKVLMEPWAIEMMISRLELELQVEPGVWHNDAKSWDRLVLLDAFRQRFDKNGKEWTVDKK